MRSDNLLLKSKVAILGARVDSDTAGVVFITAFSGLWAPYWRSDVQGTICMFTRYAFL